MILIVWAIKQLECERVRSHPDMNMVSRTSLPSGKTRLSKKNYQLLSRKLLVFIKQREDIGSAFKAKVILLRKLDQRLIMVACVLPE